MTHAEAQVNIEKCKLTTEDTEITEDKDRHWHSLREWSGKKIPTLQKRAVTGAFFYPPLS
jgi:hypothetical protein